MRLRSPKPNTEFRQLEGRLALFKTGTVQGEYWREYWSSTRPDTNGRVWNGVVHEVEELVERSVPRRGVILEAGCGPGHYVQALHARGFEAIGVELERDVVEHARAAHPDLDLRVGDIRALEFPDHSIDCYLSIGVVEHFIDGPALALHEARRVLRDDGVALIAVPYLNPSRRRHRDHVGAGIAESALRFHQYYFDRSEFEPFVIAAGFRIHDTVAYGAETFLEREHPVFSRLWHSALARARVKRIIRRSLRLSPMRINVRYGHMMMFVCVPA